MRFVLMLILLASCASETVKKEEKEPTEPLHSRIR
jgi:hypothetical protein